MLEYIKRALTLCTVIVAVIVMNLSCRPFERVTSSGPIENFQAKILENGKADWTVSEIPLGPATGFENIYFVNERVGFANDYSNFLAQFYKTTDGGISWQKVGMLSDFSISDMYFFDEKEGILIALKLSPSPSPMDNGANVLRTTDGGQSWRTVYSAMNSDFKKLTFSGDVGVIVGREDLRATNGFPKTDANNAFLLSRDKGQTWTEASNNLNQVAKDSNDRVGDFLRDVKITKDGGIVVLSATRKIFSTYDAGKSWNLISKLTDEPAQTAVNRLGVLENGGFWIGGGTGSIEGKWGLVAVIDKNGVWKLYRLDNYIFSDVEFLSENEVVAAGTVVDEKRVGGNQDLGTGAILYSTNSGKDWTIIYKSKETDIFSKVVRLSDSKLLVAGKNAVLVSLERCQ